MQTRAKMTGQLLITRQRECNISKEEQDILKHMQALGNIRMDKLDTNLGIVVYFVSCETQAIKGHLDYKKITKLQTYDGQNMIEARQKVWIILNSMQQVYSNKSNCRPEEMSKREIFERKYAVAK